MVAQFQQVTRPVPAVSPFTGRAGRVPRIVAEVLRSPGQPLDSVTRSFMEPRFGADHNPIVHRVSSLVQILAQPKVGGQGDRFEQAADIAAERVISMPEAVDQISFDFSHVRVHTDAIAADSARQLNAHAYTLGHHVVFAAGEYAPHSNAGRHLLAHELGHVVQQTAVPANGTASLPLRLQPVEPRIQGRWRMDRMTVDDNPEISFTDEHGRVTDVAAETGRGAALLNTATTWQETGFVHQKVGGKAQVAHSVIKRYVFKKDGANNEYLQVRPIGSISGNAKAEDLHYARSGSLVWGRIRERTAANPNPPDRELFSPVKNGAISAATVGDLGVIDVEIPIGERGTVNVTIPLTKVDEGTFVPYSEPLNASHETPSSYDEVEVAVGGRVQADAEIQTAFFGIAPWLSRNYNTAHANMLFWLDWDSVAAPERAGGTTLNDTASAVGANGAIGVSARPDLFRRGNASGPTIDRVRVPPHPNPDIVPHDGNVSGPGNGGVSTFAIPRSEKPWWMYASTLPRPTGVFIRNDHDRHWAWEPDGTMALDTYIGRLRSSNPSWVKTWT